MEKYKMDFIELMVRMGALLFGDFTLKSGRKSPYFINAGLFNTGAGMAQLGKFYADALMSGKEQIKFNCLYGPAYKGIPLATVTATALFDRFGMDVPFAYNRKEAKSHGEGGEIIGHKFVGGERVVVIEDVTTAGTSVRETLDILAAVAEGVKVVALIVIADRQERGEGKESAMVELGQKFGIITRAIVTLDDIVEHLFNRPIDGKVVLDDAMLTAINAYRAQWGPKN